MTETSKHVGLFVGAGALIIAATLGAHAADQNTSGQPGSLIAQAGGQGSQGSQGSPSGPGVGRGRPGGPAGRMGRGMGPGGMPGVLGVIDLPLGRLGLSPQQQDQVQAIMQSHQDEMKGLRDRATAAQGALEGAVAADTIDDNLIRARSADAAAVDADMSVARAHVRAEVLLVLTADQRAQAKQIDAAMQAARAAGRGGRGRSGQ